MASKKPNVELGFVESTDKWRLLCHLFPSKVGGKPAWLSLKGIPTGDNVRCATCDQPCVFLLQVYAPVDEKDTCFHRTLFLFMCKNALCCKPNDSSNLIIYRSQLGKKNEFFGEEPPNYEYHSESDDCPKVDKLESICAVCGCGGSKRCSKCHITTYCSKEHQAVDWKSGHKQACGSGKESMKYHKFLFPEYEIHTEPEDFDESGQHKEKTEVQALKEYKEFIQSKGEACDLHGKSNEKDLENMATKENQLDKPFRKFKKRIAHEPEQIMRYDKGGTPLWVSSEGIPTLGDIPDCACGSPRQFEFQVLPQLLNHLHVDSLDASLDWGTLVVYTCSQNCDEGGPYHKEVVWKQDFSDIDVPGLQPSTST